jgi:hypothetical protein
MMSFLPSFYDGKKENVSIDIFFLDSWNEEKLKMIPMYVSEDDKQGLLEKHDEPIRQLMIGCFV